jgi:putative spermidine/putrescine transport system permease protein
MLVFLLCLGFYITPILLGGLRDMMLAAFIDAQVSQLGNWGFAAAAAFILLCVTLLGYFGVGWVTGLKLGRPLQSSAVTPRIKTLAAVIGKGFRVAAELLNKITRQTSETAGPSVREFPASHKQHFIADVMARWFVRIWAGAVLLYLILPIFIVVPLSFSSSPRLQFPPPGFSMRWYEGYFGNPAWLNPTLLSIEVAVACMVLSTTLGTFAAYGLVRGRLRASGLVTGLLISPMIVPAIVLGVALYSRFAAWGMIGSSVSLTISHSIGALPYVVIIVSATLAGFDTSLERASLTLGAGPARTFVKITAPLIKAGIISAALLAFIHSFDELVISMFVAGARVQTLPLKMWENIRNEIDPTIAAVSCLLILLPVVLLGLNWSAQRWRNRPGPLQDLVG